jgi:hypothetical protein
VETSGAYFATTILPNAQASGSSRKIEAFANPLDNSNGSTAWPFLGFSRGTKAVSVGPLATFGGTPGIGFGGVASALGYRMNYPYIEAKGNICYPLNIPLRYTCPAGIKASPLEQVFTCSAQLAWNITDAVPAGDDAGFYVVNWTGITGSIFFGITSGIGGALARAFGIGLQPGTGTFGFFGVHGAVATFTPVNHPAGDIRAGVQVEYRIYNAHNGRGARLEVWLNGLLGVAASGLTLSAPFAAGNVFGLPYNQASDSYATMVPVVMNDGVVIAGPAYRRFYVGDFLYAQGPDEPGMF